MGSAIQPTRFALTEILGIVLLIPRLMAYMRRGYSRKRDAAPENSEEEQLERSSSACHHARGVNVAVRTLLAEWISAGIEETWAMLVSKFPSEDLTAVIRGRGECNAIERRRCRRWKYSPVAPVEIKLPRKGSGHGVVPRSMQKGRRRGAVGVREHP